MTRNYVRVKMISETEERKMKEMLKSKAILAFIVMVVGISFIGGTSTKLEQSEDSMDPVYLSYNMQ